jgi:hypothetical protein
MEQNASYDFVSLVPHVRKISWLNRVNLPQPETTVKEFVCSKYKQYSWLPNQLDIDFRKQDRATAGTFLKFNGISNSLDSELFLDSLEDVIRELNLPRFGELSTFDEFIQGMNNQSSSGYPLFIHKGKEKSIENSREFISSIMEETIEGTVLQKLFALPTVIFHRFTPKVKSNIKQVEVKTRVVFGYPMSIIGLSEIMHGKTIDFILKEVPFVLGKTRPQLSELVRFIRNYALRNGMGMISLDINQIDMNMPLSLQLLVHALLIELNVNNSEFSRVHENVCEALAHYEVSGPFCGSWGSMVVHNGGTKSGTRFNTFTNSFVLQVVSAYLSRIRGRNCRNEPGIGLSDDMVKLFSMNEVGDTSEQKALFSQTTSIFKLFGLSIHENKSVFVNPLADDIPLMGMNWDLSSRPNKDLDWVVAKLCFPERFRYEKFNERYAIRAASILFQIVDGPKYFNELVIRKVPSIKKALKQGRDPELIYYYAREGPPRHTKLPLSRLMNEGWTMF